MNKEIAVVYIFFIRNTLIVCALPSAGIEKKLTMRRLSSRKPPSCSLQHSTPSRSSNYTLHTV